MTTAERNRLFFDHVRRAGDHWFDKSLCLASFARHARARGRIFFYSQGAAT